MRTLPMKNTKALAVLFLFASLVLSTGCVTTDEASYRSERGLPQERLAFYNDPFDRLREDLWEKFTFVGRGKHKQLAGLKVADIRTQGGKLRIKTKIGSFSNGGLVTKYSFRGDFDIQLDCDFDFLKGTHDMDQQLYFGVFESRLRFDQSHSYAIIFIKRGREHSGQMISAYREKGKRYAGSVKDVGGFHGSLRIARKGDGISTLYKKEGKKKWREMDTFRSTTNDVVFCFGLSNYLHFKRNSITARSAVIARFDNFKTNSAQEIIEEDI
jgi:hypothetical protein